LKTGVAAFESVFGTDVWAWRSENFREGDVFAAYLAAETFAQAGPIVDSLNLSAPRSVVDIGGGHGGLLAVEDMLKDVLQHWDDVATRTILESCREAMPRHARLLIIERLMPKRACDDPPFVFEA
jgi:O-methyltransferase domain